MRIPYFTSLHFRFGLHGLAPFFFLEIWSGTAPKLTDLAHAPREPGLHIRLGFHFRSPFFLSDSCSRTSPEATASDASREHSSLYWRYSTAVGPAFTFVLVFIVSSSLNPRPLTYIDNAYCRTKSLCSLSVCPRQNQPSNSSWFSLSCSFPFSIGNPFAPFATDSDFAADVKG